MRSQYTDIHHHNKYFKTFSFSSFHPFAHPLTPFVCHFLPLSPSKFNTLNVFRERKISTNSRDEQEVNIQSLLPATTYRIRVVGNSNHAQGRSSEQLEITTQPEEGVVGTPENFHATTLSEQTIYLRWEAPKVTNGPIIKYRILFTQGENGAEQSAETTATEYQLDLLRSYCEYTVSVAAVNQNGVGIPTEERLVKTYSAVPSEPPLNVSLEASSSTVIDCSSCEELQRRFIDGKLIY